MFNRRGRTDLSEQEMKKLHPINNPLDQSIVHISTQPPTPVDQIRNNSREYFKNFNIEDFNSVDAGNCSIKIRIMNRTLRCIHCRETSFQSQR